MNGGGPTRKHPRKVHGASYHHHAESRQPAVAKRLGCHFSRVARQREDFTVGPELLIVIFNPLSRLFVPKFETDMGSNPRFFDQLCC